MQNKNIAELKRKITLVRSADFMLKGFLIMGLIAAESSWQFLLVIGLFFVQGISYYEQIIGKGFADFAKQ